MPGKPRKIYSKSIIAYLDSGLPCQGASCEEPREDILESEGKESTPVTLTAVQDRLETEFRQFKEGGM